MFAYMKILGGKIKRGTGVCVLKIKDRVFKIPLSLGAIRELELEREKIIEVKKDKYLEKYLLDYKYYFFIQSMPYLELISENKNRNQVINDYFGDIFSRVSQCEKINLKNLANKCYLEFVSKHFSDDYRFWDQYLTGIMLPLSSSHGDFSLDNILVKGQKLYFIDWSRYNRHSSIYFDLLNYFIFSNKDKNISWIKVWQKEMNADKKEILGITINKEHLMAYGIWKAAEELNILKLRNKLDQYKINKYINFIKIAKQLI